MFLTDNQVLKSTLDDDDGFCATVVTATSASTPAMCRRNETLLTK